jgi:hypothetical protein
MKSLSARLCPARHNVPQRASELAPAIQNMLDISTDERSWQAFLTENPEPIGWRFALGISPATLVRPQFRLGSDYVADFMVVDTPQWTQVTLIELESPSVVAFKEDGKHAPKIVEAVAQTVSWKSWARNNLSTFKHEVLKAIMEVDSFGDYTGLYQNRVIPSISAGNFHLVSAIVIGRRTKLHPNEMNQHVTNFLRETQHSMIYSFDALADTCIDRTN